MGKRGFGNGMFQACNYQQSNYHYQVKKRKGQKKQCKLETIQDSSESTKAPRTNEEKIRQEQASWKRSRFEFLEHYLKKTTVSGSNCILCNKPGAVRCLTCGNRPVFCEEDGKKHFGLKRCVLVYPSGKTLSPEIVKTEQVFDVEELDSDSDAETQNNINAEKGDQASKVKTTFVSLEGSFCQSNEYRPEELMEMGYFPGSPSNPKVGFHLKLMELASVLYTTCHCSYATIWEMVKQMHHIPPNGQIYPRFAKALRQFMFMKHLITHGRTSEMELDEFGPGITTCPCCDVDESYTGTLIFVKSLYISGQKRLTL